MFQHLFKEFLPLSDAYYNNSYTITLHIVGGLLVAITFFMIGLLCVLMAKSNPESSLKRVIMTRLFGFFLIACSMSRAINVLCLWHDYANINGYITILTGVLALFAILLIPGILREAYQTKRLKKIKEGLEKTNQHLDDLKELADKLNNEKE